MAVQDVASIYRWILDDVIAKMKPDFVQEGVEEMVLLDLRATWEQKLLEAGLLDNAGDGQQAPEPQAWHPKGEPSGGGSDEEAKPTVAPVAGHMSSGGGDSSRKRKSEAVEPQSVKHEKQEQEDTGPAIPQRDGNGDDPGEEDTQEDEDNLSDPSLSISEDDEEEEAAIGNILCALFDKVTRTKNRWKATMKSGVFHINGKDFLFHKGTGEFSF